MNKKTKLTRKWIMSGLTLSLLVPTLAACNTNKQEDSDSVRTLRIGTMYGSKQDEQYFRQQFTDMFEFTHSNIEIEVVPAIDYSEMQFGDQTEQAQVDPLKKIKDIMTGSNPVDVMIINDLSMLGTLVNENLLKQLDPMLKEDEIDINEFVPTVIDGIKEEGNGFLYGLTPTYTPSALYYNKKIFSKAGVELPTDGMSWDQVFNLAKRLKSGTGKDSVFGFSFNQWGAGDNYWDVQNFAAPLQLRMYDEKAETMTVNTPQWEAIWKSATDLYKDHVTPHQDDMQYGPTDGGMGAGKEVYNPFQGQLFMNGKVAMTVGDYGLINQIQQLNDNSEKLKMDPLEWDVVSMPYHVGKEGIGGSIYLNQLSGINANAANSEDAWEFVKFMNGKEWAKLKARSTYELSARKEYVKPRDGMTYNVEAFTKMKPAPQLNSSLKDQELLRNAPNLNLISELGTKYYAEVIEGKKTVKEALTEWETKGNDLLQKIKTNPKGAIEGYGETGGGGVVRPL
ncbi:ABC transporter substrate-binding protein [Cohnella lupini]|uniref:Multiple sugar transport system substrate-binding protein n=1 Tax=Cohnella lupini TaxID=1294267 RepID=A0A3D9IVV8_9BACL|nr:extracellular solute-binding protein [Cohnella lupini]RED65835.1 multiple sugar transport system substrate-binding protein [Cohnella lupini]